ILFCLVAPNATAKTIYIHVVDGNDNTANGTYERPFKSWRVALGHVTSGDTIIAKNGDYRKAGREQKWGGLDLTLTSSDTAGIYRYDPKNPLVIRAETRHGVIIDHIRFHLARGIVIDGFDIFPNPYYR